MDSFNIPGDQGLPVGSVIAYAGWIGDPISLPKENNKYNTGIAPDGFGMPQLEPYSWMVCDGRPLSIKDYPKLFLRLGFRYIQKGDNGGQFSPDAPYEPDKYDDTTVFRIPDYRGLFLRMVSGKSPWLDRSDNPDPDTADRKLPFGTKDAGVGSIQQDAIQTHQHGFSKAEKGGKPAKVGDALIVPPKIYNALTSTPTDASPPLPEQNTPAGDVRNSSETRAKNTYVYYLIKFA